VSYNRLVVIVALLSAAMVLAPGLAAGESATAESANATLVGAYPNPVADEDPGEFVTVRFEEPTNTSGWTLTDGKTTAVLPNRTFEGTIAVAIQPTRAKNHTHHRVAALAGRLQLADSGDRLELRAGNETLSSARYRNAPESERRDFEAGVWRPLGATREDPTRIEGGMVRAFVLPDASNVPIQEFQSADERILVGGYTFTSERITTALLDAAANGVEVRILLDGSPVGGMSDRQARLLDRLTQGGVDVRLLAGPHTRYRTHHPKYAIIDDRALVTTENFKPAGTGGMSSRGWGVVLENKRTADALASLHERDRTWRAATPWEAYRQGRTFTRADSALGGYESEYDPESIAVDSATLLVAPDNAADALLKEIEAADERILVQQVRIDSRNNRLLRAVLEAAARGVTVRIHLDGSWYVEEDNAELVAWLNRRAEASGWDLEARVDDPDGYEKIHTKGVIIDETVAIGSLNWVRAATDDNREVLLALEGSEVTAYYAAVFEDDWGDNDRSLPAGVLAVAAGGGAGALLLIRRIGFVGRNGIFTDWGW
jgi:cardiolipin synthase